MAAESLAHYRTAILNAAARHGARNVRVFGSVARGDDRAESDIDLRVDIEAGRTLLAVIALEQDLQDLLGRKVIYLEHIRDVLHDIATYTSDGRRAFFAERMRHVRAKVRAVAWITRVRTTWYSVAYDVEDVCRHHPAAGVLRHAYGHLGPV
jgi:predicted nucleotidyltransferase